MKLVLGYSSEIPDNGYVIETAENAVSISGNGTRGKRKRLLSALICAAAWTALYSLTVFLVGEVALGGSAKNLCLAVAYILTGIEALTMLGAMIKNLLKKNTF